MKQQKEALKYELCGLELSVEATRNIRKTAESGVEKLAEKHSKIIVEIQSYSIINQKITQAEHERLMKRSG